MARELRMHRRAAASGRATSLVMFVHGYGADGRDLLGLADPLGPHLPDTAFAAPDAAEPCGMNPMGYQWAPIPWMDGSDPKAAEEAFLASAADLDAAADALLREQGLPPDRLILFGFSQGTMVSLHAAPRRPEPVAGVVGFSGRLLVPERLPREIRSKPPVFLLHGDADDVVPHSSLAEAETALRNAEIEVRALTIPGTGHGIDPRGLGAALGFIKARLGEEAPAG